MRVRVHYFENGSIPTPSWLCLFNLKVSALMINRIKNTRLKYCIVLKHLQLVNQVPRIPMLIDIHDYSWPFFNKVKY